MVPGISSLYRLEEDVEWSLNLLLSDSPVNNLKVCIVYLSYIHIFHSIPSIKKQIVLVNRGPMIDHKLYISCIYLSWYFYLKS